MIKKSKIKYSYEIGSNHKEHGWLLPKKLTWSNLSLIKVFKKWNWYIINENSTNIWEKIF